MGTVETIDRHKNRYRIWTTVHGKRQSKRIVADGVKHARKILVAWEAEIAAAPPLIRSIKPSLHATASTWVAECTTLAPATRNGYNVALQQLAKHDLGSKPVDDVTAADIKAILSTVAAVSPDYARRLRTVLNCALRDAVVMGVIQGNPVSAVRAPAVKTPEINPPTQQVLKALLATANRQDDKTIGVAFMLSAATGARRAEVCGLRWEDVQWTDSGATLLIKRTIHEIKGGGWTAAPTKTRGSVRFVSIDAATAARLVEHQSWQDAWQVECGRPPSPWVLTDRESGDVWLPGRMSHAWDRVRAETKKNVPEAAAVRLHDVRHWHATTLLDQGVAVPTVAARLGHSSGVTTIKIYGHRTVQADARSASLIGQLL